MHTPAEQVKQRLLRCAYKHVGIERGEGQLDIEEKYDRVRRVLVLQSTPSTPSGSTSVPASKALALEALLSAPAQAPLPLVQVFLHVLAAYRDACRKEGYDPSDVICIGVHHLNPRIMQSLTPKPRKKRVTAR